MLLGPLLVVGVVLAVVNRPPVLDHYESLVTGDQP